MSRKRKSDAQAVSFDQLGMFDSATMNGFEPAIDASDHKSNTSKKKKKPKYPGMDKWEKPFLRDDGLIWTYVGYGEWEALPLTHTRGNDTREYDQNDMLPNVDFLFLSIVFSRRMYCVVTLSEYAEIARFL